MSMTILIAVRRESTQVVTLISRVDHLQPIFVALLPSVRRSTSMGALEMASIRGRAAYPALHYFTHRMARIKPKLADAVS